MSLRNGSLKCDMAFECPHPVTHLDEKGYVYCTEHGKVRKYSHRCRKLKSQEIKQLAAGRPKPPQGFIDAVTISDDLRCTGPNSNAFDCPVHSPSLNADAKVEVMLDALKTTLANIRSLMAANPGVSLYDPWEQLVASTIAKAEGKE